MNITNEIRDKILNSIDIIELIGSAINLKRRGSNYIGLCPFHNEKTPSFTVSPDRGIYKCFGCGASGNAITFQMEYYRMTYPEAIKDLANKVGITIEDKPFSPEQKIRMTEKDEALKALSIASDFYHKMLKATAGKKALQYFKNRDLSMELINSFKLGFAPDSWNSLIIHLKKEHISESTMLDAGLVIKKDSGRIYDRFRNRVVFPILDHLGKTVGFGARILVDDKQQAKYINSPQTIVYDKSKILYGLFQAKNEIRNKTEAILTEGYADVLTLHQAGYNYAIASSGTSLTNEQLNNLSRYCKSLYIVYDADNAGIKATIRALEIALSHNFSVKIVSLPSEQDPDSIIRELGAKNFQIYLDNSLSFLDYLVNYYKNAGKFNNPSSKAETIRALVKLISKMPDRLQHDDYISKLANLLSLSERQVEQIYQEKKSIEQKNKNIKKNLTKINPVEKNALIQNNRDNEKKLEDTENYNLIPEEVLLLQIGILDKNSIKLMKDIFGLDVDLLQSNTAKRLLSLIIDFSKKSEDIAQAMFEDESIDESDKEFLTNLIFSKSHISHSWSKFTNVELKNDTERGIRDIVNRLKIISIDKQLDDIMGKLHKNIPLDEQLILTKKIKELSSEKKIIEQLLIK